MKNKRKKLAAVGVVSASILLFVGKKTLDLAAPPTHPKTCDLYYPANADQAVATHITITQDLPLNFVQKGGVINDASCLNKTAIFGIADIRNEQDVKNAFLFARENGLKITPAGQRHSMGGQSFTRGGLVLDMRNFRSVALDAEHRLVTVQSGATWVEVQKILDANALSVKSMQSINIFTVGGTLSVNAHGIAHNPGNVAPTVRSLRVLLPDGQIVTASPTENIELFRHVLGGYGLFGTILTVDLDVVPNEAYEWQTSYIDYKDIPEFYRQNIDDNANIGLFYARLSVAPKSYLRETAIHTYHRSSIQEPLPPLEPEGLTWINRFVINFSKTGAFGRSVRWWLEKHVEPGIHTCLSRNQAMSGKEVCIVSRNQEMFDSMGYLKNRLRDTDILQEYFVPRDQLPAFVDGLRSIVGSTDVNLLNVTVRNVQKDEITALPYAQDDVFGLVLYFNQQLNSDESKKLEQTTQQLIDLSLSLGGTFYLPYQLYYTPDQLRAAYPTIDQFFDLKRTYDPEGLLTNSWYEKYRQEF